MASCVAFVITIWIASPVRSIRAAFCRYTAVGVDLSSTRRMKISAKVNDSGDAGDAAGTDGADGAGGADGAAGARAAGPAGVDAGFSSRLGSGVRSTGCDGG